jgi:peptidyl-prolyl cis-trans isomerase B (cyclophilin B)
MRRLAAAVAASAALLAAAPAPPAAGKDCPYQFKVKAEKEEVALGDRIVLNASLSYSGARASSCGELKLGSPSGVSFYVKVDGRETHQISRLLGRYAGGRFAESPEGRKEMKRGDVVIGKIEVVAIRTGKWEITPIYGGCDRLAWPSPVEAKPLKVTVGPGPKGETRVGARIRTSKGEMVAELLPDKAFNTVHNFLSLAGSRFYDGRVFHRVMKDFMIQGGCPNGDGSGGPGWCLPLEANDLKHEKGVLSMARESHPDSAGCQFFVMTGKATHLDGTYTGFGRLVEGEKVLDDLASVPTKRDEKGEMSDPVEDPKILGVDPVLLK